MLSQFVAGGIKCMFCVHGERTHCRGNTSHNSQAWVSLWALAHVPFSFADSLYHFAGMNHGCEYLRILLYAESCTSSQQITGPGGRLGESSAHLPILKWIIINHHCRKTKEEREQWSRLPVLTPMCNLLVWAGTGDSLLMNGIWQMWWDVTSKTRLQKTVTSVLSTVFLWLFSLATSYETNCHSCELSSGEAQVRITQNPTGSRSSLRQTLRWLQPWVTTVSGCVSDTLSQRIRWSHAWISHRQNIIHPLKRMDSCPWQQHRWMDLEGIMLNEVSKTEKDK